ncbi:hypothetical protein Cal7507_3730 [Calothrix sp. PCC 7507]|nr:hypothetical protein Cal7507_3730 [Calothrix sp. PCC 7507]
MSGERLIVKTVRVQGEKDFAVFAQIRELSLTYTNLPKKCDRLICRGGVSPIGVNLTRNS